MTLLTRQEAELFAGLSARLRRIAAELRTRNPAQLVPANHIAQRIEGYARAIEEDLRHSASPLHGIN